MNRFLHDPIDCIRSGCDMPRMDGIILIKTVRTEIGVAVILVPGKQIEPVVRGQFGRPPRSTIFDVSFSLPENLRPD